MTVELEGRRISIRGIVQGVGFRPWVYRLAHEAGIRGSVRNDSTGVLIEAFGSSGSLAEFVQQLETSAPPAASIAELTWEAIPAQELSAFEIERSEAGSELRVSIPADLATCDRCLEEIFDPANRRYRYAFTNCTDCGPRFTIVREVPYDRPATTMSVFEMCPSCQAEYDNPVDRRFHAQPNACPECGPQLRLLNARGDEMPAKDPLATTARALKAGRIVAVKGLGGFHLACDATSSSAVGLLRQRKRRDAKPFAVMVRNLDAAEALARLGDSERRILQSVERPIVLAPLRAETPLAPEVAPGISLVGLMLPYTPLHHLLLADAEIPLVMTSANVSEEPIAYRNGEAIERLRHITDLFLLHDREIETRCEDSVARAIDGAPMLIRRSRGYVPRPIRLRNPVAAPILACGAHLKNTFCIALGDQAFLGPHIGDLETLEAVDAFREAVSRMERFLAVRPELIAHDLHPEYQSTIYARSRSEIPRVAVQHHHAHVASVMAEYGLEGPVLGLAFDGTGDGGDGTAWGGEFLLATGGKFQRLATLRPIALPGGDLAIHEIWRLALALLDDAYGEDALSVEIPLLRGLSERQLAIVPKMIHSGLQAPLAHGAGRYFDAVAALALGRSIARYEGQAALEWNLAADPDERGTYPYEIDDSLSPWQVDLRPMTRAIVDDLAAATSPTLISARFHNTLTAASEAVVREVLRELGRTRIVLSGGCFQNPLLVHGLRNRLSQDFEVFVPSRVPPGDGGIALGQAFVAHAVARS